MSAIRAATSDELVLLRKKNGQWSKPFLAGLENPPVVFSCVINQVFTTTDGIIELVYDTATGDYADVIPGMTVWIGSSAGHYDYGIVRARKDWTADTAFISETSDIEWAEDLHITVVDEMGIWAKHIYIDPDDGTVFMDRDVEYTDEHVDFEPVPILGSDVVVDTRTYPVVVNFPDVADSWVFDSTISSYLCTASAGVVTNETTSNPTLTISSYPANGRIRVAVTVTAANGKSYTGYRYVYVYDTTHQPFTKFSISECGGSFEDGGWSFSVTISGDVERANVRDRCPIILFARNYYGGTKQSLGQLSGRENIRVAGWVDGETINYDPIAGSVSFTVKGANFWLDKITGFPQGVMMAKHEPSAWTDMTALTVDRALFHLLHHRSTITSVCDLRLTGDTRYASELTSASATLWSQIKEVAASSIFALPGVDQYGRLFVFVHPQFVPEADRDWATIQTFTTDDWYGKITIKRSVVPQISMLSLSGVAVNATGKPTAYFSLANGHVFKRYGSVEVIEKILLSDQTQSNELCGLAMGYKNSQYPDVEISLIQNNTMFTMFPAQFVHLDLAEEDTPRGVTFSRNFIIKNVSYEWDNENRCFLTTLSLEAETFAELAVNGDVPGVIDDGDITDPPDDDDLDVPIDIVILPPTDTNENHPKKVVIASTMGVYWTETFDKASDDPDPENRPTYFKFDGIPEDDENDISEMFVTPDGKIWVYSINGSGSIFVSPGLGWPFTLLVSGNDLGSGFEIACMGFNPFENSTVMFSAGVHDNFDLYETDGFTYSAKGHTIHYNRPFWGMDGQCIFYAGGYWLHFGNIVGVFSTAWYIVFNSDGSAGLESGDATTTAGQDFTYRRGIPVGTQVSWFQWDGSGAGRYNKGTGVGPFTHVRSDDAYPSPRGAQGVAISPTGTIAIASDNAYTVYRSTDGGDTWESIADTMPVGTGVIENCRDDNRFIIAGGTAIRLTLDVGETYYDKSGNLPYIAALINITHVRFIE